MVQPSLTVPVLVGGCVPEPGTLHFEPTHVATWTTSSQAGPSRHLALAAPDNTVWVYPVEAGSAVTAASTKYDASPVPDIRATSPTPSGTPRNDRPTNPRVTSFTNRSRAPSTASSTRTSSSRRHVTPFSPPTTAQPVTASLSPTTATASASDGHSRADSLTERAELLEHLREQQARPSEDGRSHVGLGINFGRKLDVHGQVEHNERVSGATSPKSVKSQDSQRTSIGGRLMGWAKGEDSEELKAQKELDEQVAEIAVEREMQLETEKDARQEDEMKTIEEAIARASPNRQSSPGQAARGVERPVRRIVLRQPGHGKIVDMQVYEDLGLLCVLRDIGLFDTFKLSDLSVQDAIDLEEAESRGIASSSKDLLRLTPFWQWRTIHVARLDKTPILALAGLPWACGMPCHNGDVTRVVLVSLGTQRTLHVESRLDLPGQGSIGLVTWDSEAFLIHSTSTSLTSYQIRRRVKQLDAPQRPSSAMGIKQNRAISSAHPLPRLQPDSALGEADQPLLRKNRSVSSLRDAQSSSAGEHKSFAKFLAAKRADWRGGKQGDSEEQLPTDSIILEEACEVERDGGGTWDSICMLPSGDGLGIVSDAVDAFTCDGRKLRIQKTFTSPPGDTIQGVAVTRSLRNIVIASNNGISILSIVGSTYERRYIEGSSGLSRIYQSGESNVLSLAGGCLRQLAFGTGQSDGQVVLRTAASNRPSGLSHIVPSPGGLVWCSDGNGNIHRQALTHVLRKAGALSDDRVDAYRLDSPVTCMRTVKTDQALLVAGDEDGAVRIWSDISGQLLASWTLFANPVDRIALIDMPDAGVLQGHLLCTSRDGTVAVITLEGLEHLYLIPASRGPLRRLFVKDKDILLAYANGKARLWNVDTMEFRRSTGLDAADDMLVSGGWKEVQFGGGKEQHVLSPIDTAVPSSPDIGCALCVDPRNIAGSAKTLPTPHAFAMLSGLLSLFVTFGLDETIDSICRDHLGVVQPEEPVLAGSRESGVSVLEYAFGAEAWRVSASATGVRQLIILSLLRPFLDSEEHERYAAQVIAFYATGLPEDAIPADLDFFASFYLDQSGEVQQAARMLFNATLDRMTEAQLAELVAVHQPRIQTTGAASDDAALALLMVGAIALHKYQSVNPDALKSGAEAIMAILREPSSPHLGLAIELCSKGFTIWQTFADPMELLRRLFHLSTSKDAAANNAQARLAVLHVASSNAPLFMSTLSMDILDAQSAEGRTSIMKLCVYMARKKPEVLENGLPRIAEAVVKSLDPNIAKMREDVWQVATVILNELVLAFSTIDFHSGTQKLAVGTHEGAVIMYELKTASRLYVLEPHRAPVSSVTFSPDGRRLITVSLEEGVVTVWKVGSSISGFFNVGGPPRQGALGGTGPFKRIEFARVEDGPLKSTSALSDVHVTWPGARQAKVMIGETAMSFET